MERNLTQGKLKQDLALIIFFLEEQKREREKERKTKRRNYERNVSIKFHFYFKKYKLKSEMNVKRAFFSFAI